MRILKRIQFITTWLLILFIASTLFYYTYSYVSKLDFKTLVSLVSIIGFVVFSFIIHLWNRNNAVSEIIDDIQLKVEKNHISTNFYNTHIFPVIMEMQNPFTLRKPTLKNYFNEQMINQYLS